MTANWEIEAVPNADLLYMRVHRTTLNLNGQLTVGAFRDRDGHGMSTDWDKYSYPHETRNRAKIPGDNAVISLNVGTVRNIAGLSVMHSPLPDNRAHTDVRGIYGANKTESRARLLRIARIVLPLDAS